MVCCEQYHLVTERGGGIRAESETKIHNPGCTDTPVCAMHNSKTERDFIKTGYTLVGYLCKCFFNIFPENLRINLFSYLMARRVSFQNFRGPVVCSFRFYSSSYPLFFCQPQNHIPFSQREEAF